ncbi:hypothetical protein VCRA2113O325_80159 [Vibrio crassostreae]|nr:hypothetical protein VCRA2111O320_110109 [Vibrio crassostreae]CAK2234547.1 hypothetical protein VCRA2113O326_90037 [Vibrio crassostreae]CAK2484459.1 hypothetical protein VCRA2119O48_380024 [Vibrio crassostreae]CAK2985433.1 hypothetical protein VCRA2113O323_70046 [Vibrio crassostreae]CAK3022965.1 hypothetical protein VCRA2113O321_80158 [Vibrio crassostreae]
MIGAFSFALVLLMNYTLMSDLSMCDQFVYKSVKSHSCSLFVTR